MRNRRGPAPRFDHDAIVARYGELHNLAATGREFGISRERVRQLVRRRGINTGWVNEPASEKPPKFCPVCGVLVTNSHARYCPEHRTAGERSRRAYLRRKADPVRYARLLEQISASKQRQRARQGAVRGVSSS